MNIKILLILAATVTLQDVEVATHTHDDDAVRVYHSGRLDKCGGHNCSQKSKDKGLCTGYHYHKPAKC